MSQVPAQTASEGKVVPEASWRRFHKVTPVAQLGTFWWVIVVALVSIVFQELQDGNLGGIVSAIIDVTSSAGASSHVALYVLLVLGGLLLLSLLIVAWLYLAWRKQGYALVESGVHLRRGILFKHHQQMRWDRVQTVDVNQRLFGRIFGFGSVKVSAASTGDDINLGLLRLRQCAKLRHEILQIQNRVRAGLPLDASYFADADAVAQRQVSGVNADAATPRRESQIGDVFAQESEGALLGATSSQASLRERGAHPDDVMQLLEGGVRQLRSDELPEFDADDYESDREIYRLSLRRLVASAAFDTKTVVMFWVSVPTIVAAAYAPASAFALIVPIAVMIWNLISSLSSRYGTRIYISEHGLRRRAGLTTLKTRTIPPQRVHAVQISQPLLWRRANWWNLTVVVAGVDLVDGGDLAGDFMFAAKPEELLPVLWTLMPQLGTHDDLTLLREAFEGQGGGEFFTGATDRAKLLDPISRSGRGLCLTDVVAIIRSGRFARKISFILQDHVQSVGCKVGPLQRRRNLATLAFHLVLAPVMTNAQNFDRELVEQWVFEETQRGRRARAQGVSESLEEWKRRLGFADGADAKAPKATHTAAESHEL